MPHDQLTVTVDPRKEPQAYPVWRLDQCGVSRLDTKQGPWCWTARTTELAVDLQHTSNTLQRDDISHIMQANPAYFFYGADRHTIVMDARHT